MATSTIHELWLKHANVLGAAIGDASELGDAADHEAQRLRDQAMSEPAQSLDDVTIKLGFLREALRQQEDVADTVLADLSLIADDVTRLGAEG